MQTRAINPQSWLGGFHVNMGTEVSGAQRTLYVSGMTSNAADGSPQHEGDIVAQFKLAWKNLCEVLEASNMKPENIVRLNFYTTDVDGFMKNAEQLVPIWAGAGCKPASTLLGVQRLFLPSILIEIEATAVA
jgi:enamine deaminase RidA (YjgF/YER057c/UK114 family)